jgi:hypothetical protein
VFHVTICAVNRLGSPERTSPVRDATVVIAFYGEIVLTVVKHVLKLFYGEIVL